MWASAPTGWWTPGWVDSGAVQGTASVAEGVVLVGVSAKAMPGKKMVSNPTLRLRKPRLISVVTRLITLPRF